MNKVLVEVGNEPRRILVKCSLSSRKSMCKGPEVETCLARARSDKSGEEGREKRDQGDEHFTQFDGKPVRAAEWCDLTASRTESRHRST